VGPVFFLDYVINLPHTKKKKKKRHDSPNERTEADVDEIANELQQLIAFQKYNKKDLSDFGLVVLSEEIEAGQTGMTFFFFSFPYLFAFVLVVTHGFFPHIVFKQGDPGSEYYVIYKGSVDVLVSKTDSAADEEVVCSLAEGFGFGDMAILKGVTRCVCCFSFILFFLGGAGAVRLTLSLCSNATIKTKENSIFLKVRGSAFTRVHKRNSSSEPIPVSGGSRWRSHMQGI